MSILGCGTEAVACTQALVSPYLESALNPSYCGSVHRNKRIQCTYFQSFYQTL